MNKLRKIIREAMKDVYAKIDAVNSQKNAVVYSIKWRPKKNTYLLYKKFRGEDEYGNINTQIKVDAELSPIQDLAQKEARAITGQELEIAAPHELKEIPNGDKILPFGQYKGEQISSIPIDLAIPYIYGLSKAGRMSEIRRDKWLTAIYDYLTIEARDKTKEYLTKIYKAQKFKKLANFYNKHIELYNTIHPTSEQVMFQQLQSEILKKELDSRFANFNPDGTVIVS